MCHDVSFRVGGTKENTLGLYTTSTNLLLNLLRIGIC